MVKMEAWDEIPTGQSPAKWPRRSPLLYGRLWTVDCEIWAITVECNLCIVRRTLPISLGYTFPTDRLAESLFYWNFNWTNQRLNAPCEYAHFNTIGLWFDSFRWISIGEWFFLIWDDENFQGHLGKCVVFIIILIFVYYFWRFIRINLYCVSFYYIIS